ncbi:hypothetical protein ACFE04_031263 [Oxalis oulophora]
MAKRAQKSKQPSSSSSSSNSRGVLRAKSADGTKRSTRKGMATRQSVSTGDKEKTSKSMTQLRNNKQKSKTKKVDAKMPKKPPTAFFYYLEDFRKGFQEQNPGVKSMRDVGKACGEKWNTMNYEEKVEYYDIAAEKRAEFDRAMADYIKRKENGEDEDSEDNSEFEM